MSVTYEEIKKANESIHTMLYERKDRKTGTVSKNEYATVSERIKAFRMVYPDGCIKTKMISNENGVCIFKAFVYVGEKLGNYLIATGTAYEKESSSFINQGSYIENCETSAVGRALGMAGFGIDTGIASAEEVQNAELNQNANETIPETHAKALEKRCAEDGVDVDALCKLYKVKTLADLTMKKYVNIHENWDKISLMGKEKK